MDRKALGKGISALIPEYEKDHESRVVFLKLDQIKPNPLQPREDFDPQSLEELRQSIKEKGVIQPILVRHKGIYYELIAGERRYRAACALSLPEIPAIIKDVGDEDSLELSLIENIQRQNLNAIEEARAYQYLIDKYQLTQERISEVLGKARVTVTNILRLLKLPIEIQDEMKKGRITFAHGRALLEIDDLNKQRYFVQKIIANSLSVRELENLIKSHRSKKVRTHPITSFEREPYLNVVEEQLQHILGTKVRVIKKKKRGHIQIEFYSQEDLERIVNKLQGGEKI